MTVKMSDRMENNVILQTDSYKTSHWRQYPPNTQNVFSFFESRGGQEPETVFFGLQYLLKKYLVGKQVTTDKINKAEELIIAHMGANSFNRAGWEYILDVHSGKLPLEICAVPEGISVPNSNVLMTVVNTDPKCYWLTNYIETLLVQTWYPSTVCTLSKANRRIILNALTKTGTPGLIDFKLHDFGYRGSTSVESAGIGGCAHLVNFLGTDTIAALIVARDYYGEDMAGFSIPAAEHSTITSWGRDRETDAYANMLEQYPTGLVAVVSDSYDIYNACLNIWGNKLRDKILSRDGTLIIRPDSGDPVIVIMEILGQLESTFGTSINMKGYKVLNDKVRIIQGDGIDPAMIKQILIAMESCKWSADNIAFGSGGGLLQKMDRDTQKFAFKCSSIKVNEKWRDVIKTPVTDPGKNSKAGRLKLIREGNEHKTVAIPNSWQEGKYDPTTGNCLVPVFRNGELLVDYSLKEIRERARFS